MAWADFSIRGGHGRPCLRNAWEASDDKASSHLIDTAGHHGGCCNSEGPHHDTLLAAWIFRSVVATAAAWWLVSGGPALANNDKWDAAASGVWETGSNWADNGRPGSFDEATFNLAGAYTVTFNGVPVPIQALSLTGAANVTFTSANSVDIRTLRVNSPITGGPQDVDIRNGATLSLGTFFFVGGNKPLHLTVGQKLSVNSGSTLNVRFGSDVVTSGLNVGGQVNVSSARAQRSLPIL